MTRAMLLCLLGPVLIATGMPAAAADVQQDRASLTAWLRIRFPHLTANDYVRTGAAFDNALGQVSVTPEMRDVLLARGQTVWERRFRNGRNLRGCFPNGGKRVAATYPQFDARSGQVVTLESAINRCLTLHGEKPLDFGDDADAIAVLAHVRNLSDRLAVNVRVNGKAAQAQYDAGKRLFHARMGQQNFACASCHIHHAGTYYRDQPLAAALGQTAQWPRFNASGTPVALQTQYRHCLTRMGYAAPEFGAPMLNQLEYYHTALSNGLPMTALPPR